MENRPSPEPLDGGTQPIHHIGVCVDRSPIGDRIVPYAAALARAFGAKLTILHALEPPHEGANAAPTDPLDWEVERAVANRHIAALQSELVAADFPITIEVLEGRPAEEIRDWVSSHGVDLTVLASHGESGLTEWSLASTARKLLEGICGSILLVPASSVQEPVKLEVRYDRVLVLLDGSARAESALPVAVNVARTHGSELILLHVVATPERPCPGALDAQEHDLDQRLVDRNARAAEAYLAGVREHVATCGVRVRALVTVDGDVRGEILRHTAEGHADLVVFSGHGHSGRAELPFGSVAGFLLERAAVPLLVVRERTSHVTRPLPRSRSREGLRLPLATTS